MQVILLSFAATASYVIASDIADILDENGNRLGQRIMDMVKVMWGR